MLHEKIREHILEQGLKFSSIAAKLGISPATFSDIMNGKRKLGAEEYRLICQILNVSMTFFVNDTKSKTA